MHQNNCVNVAQPVQKKRVSDLVGLSVRLHCEVCMSSLTNWNSLFFESQLSGNGEGMWAAPSRLTKNSFFIFTCSNTKKMRVYTQIRHNKN
jgi:hypothetical protein